MVLKQRSRVVLITLDASVDLAVDDQRLAFEHGPQTPPLAVLSGVEGVEVPYVGTVGCEAELRLETVKTPLIADEGLGGTDSCRFG